MVLPEQAAILCGGRGTRLRPITDRMPKPKWDLARGGKELVETFRRINFTEEQFRGRMTNRLMQLEFLLRSKGLTRDLRHV